MKTTVTGGKKQYLLPKPFGYQLARCQYGTQSTAPPPLGRRKVAVTGSGKKRTAVWPWVQNPPKLKGNWKQIFMQPAVHTVLKMSSPPWDALL